MRVVSGVLYSTLDAKWSFAYDNRIILTKPLMLDISNRTASWLNVKYLKKLMNEEELAKR